MNLCPHPVALNEKKKKKKGKENKEQGEGGRRHKFPLIKWVSHGDVMHSMVDSSLVILYCIFDSY